MSKFGSENVSRLSIGLFTLALVGGLAAFFTGALDSVLGNTPKVTHPSPAPMPFAKVKAATPDKPHIAAASAPMPAPIQFAPAPVQTQATPIVSVSTSVKVEPATAQTKSGAAVPKSHETEPTRPHDLDLRSCLALQDNLAIAHCAYQIQR